MNPLVIEPGSHRGRLSELVDSTNGPIRVASAYVTDAALLLSARSAGREVRLLSALSVMDIVAGATSLAALQELIDGGVQCRCMDSKPRFHAKVYIFGSETAVVTSANLTRRALDQNIEVGVPVDAGIAKELAQWFDLCWKTARPLAASDIIAWKKRTEGYCKQFNLLRLLSRADEPTFAQSGDETMIPNPVLSRPLRWFMCNTNRRYGKRAPAGRFDQEERMQKEGLALAWEPFRSRNDMGAVAAGDVVLMYANLKGVIAVGQAKGNHRVLEGGGSDAVSCDPGTQERQVPLKWLVWEDDKNACPWKPHVRITFKDVSGDKFAAQRKTVIQHFFGGDEGLAGMLASNESTPG